MNLTVIDRQSPFESVVYYGTNAAAMTLAAMAAVALSEQHMPVEQVAGVTVALFVGGVLMTRQILAWVEDRWVYDAERRGLFAQRRVGPFRSERELATAASMKTVRVMTHRNVVPRYHAGLRDRGAFCWIEVETADGETLRLSDQCRLADDGYPPDRMVDEARRLAGVFGVPLEPLAA